MSTRIAHIVCIAQTTLEIINNACPKQQVSDERDVPDRIVLPFKDQKSASAVGHQRSDLSRKIDADVHPVYASHKIKGKFKPKEHKPPIVNQQNVLLCTLEGVALVIITRGIYALDI